MGKKIGEGGYGVVFIGTYLNQPIAIKVFETKERTNKVKNYRSKQLATGKKDNNYN